MLHANIPYSQYNGDLKTIQNASRKALEYVQWATELQKVECTSDELYVSIKCGESDTTSGLAANPTVGDAVTKLVKMGGTVSFGETSEITGAEHVVRERGATKEIGEQFYKVWSDYNDFINANKTDDLSDSQPTTTSAVNMPGMMCSMPCMISGKRLASQQSIRPVT